MNNEQGVFQDNKQAAYLIAQRRYPLRYQPIKENGVVQFLFTGAGLDKAVQAFFANDAIPVQDYIAALATVTNTVYALKGR
jgi:hypothetical protein